MFKGGTILQAAVMNGSPWQKFVTTAPDLEIVKLDATLRDERNFLNGGYQYIKPTDSSQIKFTQKACTTVNASGGITNTEFPLWATGSYNIVYIRTSPQSGSYSGASVRFDYSWGVQFIPTTQWYDTTPSMMSDNMVNDCLFEISQAQQFYSNDGHWQAIKDWLSSKADWFKGALKTVGKAITDKVLPLVPVVGEPAKDYLDKTGVYDIDYDRAYQGLHGR
jgi:hypothetical protein